MWGPKSLDADETSALLCLQHGSHASLIIEGRKPGTLDSKQPPFLRMEYSLGSVYKRNLNLYWSKVRYQITRVLLFPEKSVSHKVIQYGHRSHGPTCPHRPKIVMIEFPANLPIHIYFQKLSLHVWEHWIEDQLRFLPLRFGVVISQIQSHFKWMCTFGKVYN